MSQPDARSAASDRLPAELERLLKDPRIKIKHDGKLDMALYVLDNVPCDTASAMTIEQWRDAWVREWQRANLAEVKGEELREALTRIVEGVRGSGMPPWYVQIAQEALDGNV